MHGAHCGCTAEPAYLPALACSCAQCVFLTVAASEATMQAAALARQLYGMTTGPYMPHLSLLYADLSDAEKDKVGAA